MVYYIILYICIYLFICIVFMCFAFLRVSKEFRGDQQEAVSNASTSADPVVPVVRKFPRRRALH